VDQAITLEFNATIPLSDTDAIQFEELDKKSRNAENMKENFHGGSPVLA